MQVFVLSFLSRILISRRLVSLPRDIFQTKPFFLQPLLYQDNCPPGDLCHLDVRYAAGEMDPKTHTWYEFRIVFTHRTSLHNTVTFA